MSSKRYKPSFDVTHIGEMAKIDNTLQARGEVGILPHLVELIARLTSGGIGSKSDDQREVEAKRLWDLGVGRELGFDSMPSWLESIPPVPERPADEELNTLVLVPDQKKIGVTKSCSLIGMVFGGDDKTFVDREPDKALSGTYWMWVQDGRNYQGKQPKVCRDGIFPSEGQVALTAHEGLWLFARDSEILKHHHIDLPGSDHAGRRGDVACLRIWGGHQLLDWRWSDFPSGEYGSASRGSVSA